MSHENESLLLEHAKDMYHTRLNSLSNLIARGSLMLAINGILISITTDISWWGDTHFNIIFKVLFVVFALGSATASMMACSIKKVPLFDVSAARRNAGRSPSLAHYTDSLLNFYEKSYKKINTTYSSSTQKLTWSYLYSAGQVICFCVSLVLKR
ncbi:MAG: hypothetical protein JWN38_1039 [Candidatus Saccharibacteria bacterium]|nr:hypothetical protein [Candidatus Saccharibacteria bacterium]